MDISQSGFSSPEGVEDSFYAAFSNCDSKAMEILWADDEVICVHPGSQGIVGYEAVMRSWAYILDGAEMPAIQVNVVKRTVSDTLAVHVVEEHISTGESSSAVMLATNVYRKYDAHWLMVEHHASVSQMQAEAHTLQ